MASTAPHRSKPVTASEQSGKITAKLCTVYSIIQVKYCNRNMCCAHLCSTVGVDYGMDPVVKHSH